MYYMDNLWSCRGVARVSGTHILAKAVRDELGSESSLHATRCAKGSLVADACFKSGGRIITSFHSRFARIDQQEKLSFLPVIK